jgi:nitroreductase
MSETTDQRTARDRIYFLRSLRAVRSFRPDPVPQEVLDDVLEVARWSGSASNKQPWEIVVIREGDTLRSLASVGGYAGHLAGAPLGIVLVMAGERAEHRLVRRFRQGRGKGVTPHTRGEGSAECHLPRLPRRGGPQIPRAGTQTPRRDRPHRKLRLGEP